MNGAVLTELAPGSNERLRRAGACACPTVPAVETCSGKTAACQRPTPPNSSLHTIRSCARACPTAASRRRDDGGVVDDADERARPDHRRGVARGGQAGVAGMIHRCPKCETPFPPPREERSEWKLHGHDLPPDLPERLRRAGFEPEDRETIVIARVADIASPPSPPDGVTLREVTERADLNGSPPWSRWSGRMTTAGYLTGSARACRRPRRDVDRGRRGRRRRRLRPPGSGTSTEPTSPRSGAAPRCPTGAVEDLQGDRCAPGRPRRRARLPPARGRRVRRQPPDLERLGFVPVTTTTPFIWSPG